jgi:hypothetical protein
MEQQQQSQLLQIQIQQLQNQRFLPLQQQNEQLQQQIQELQQQSQQNQQQEHIQQLQQPDFVESDEDESDEEEEDDDDPLVMGWELRTACEEGEIKKIGRLLDAGKNVNCVSSGNYVGMTPIMVALFNCQLNAAIMLHYYWRGADLYKVDNDGANILHVAAEGGDLQCIKWVLANASIDVNTNDDAGYTPIRCAVRDDHFDAGKLLVERGANLFKKNYASRESAMDHRLGPDILQHAKDLIWLSVKPLLLLSSACSTNALPSDPSISTPLSLVKALSISGLVREWIAPYVMRKGLIIRDPSIPRPPQSDDVKRRIEAELAAAARSSSSA